MNETERRVQLQTEFETFLGTRNVYFQPPESKKLSYPCIIYYKTRMPVRYANDSVYKKMQCYTVTVVDKDPDSMIADRMIEQFKYCSIESYYRSENLNHTKLTLFY